VIDLLDTNTLVYALNRQGGVRERVNDAALRNRLATSSIVVAELLYGAGRSSRPEENRKVVLRGIERFQIVPFTFATAEHFARLMTDLAARGKKPSTGSTNRLGADVASPCQLHLAHAA
jgi:tRNA(fMet)-specific endonuclease VapC